MPELRLTQLPDRSPVKLAIVITPDLHHALQDYGKAYAESYGREEPLAELIPAMLANFLESDRNFLRWRGQSGHGATRS